MAASGNLDRWREYFRSANSDIFGIIEHAILVAASDCPFDFKSKRDGIAELLFSCKLTKCSGCDRFELAVPSAGDEGSETKSGVEAGGSKDTTKESRDDNGADVEVAAVEMKGDVGALNDELEEESRFYGEVLRIKGVLDHHDEESDTVLFDSLRRLQLMTLSVETLKATGIGKSVNALRKRKSKEIRNLVTTLIEDWKLMVDSWVDATKAIEAAEIQTESVKTSAVEDEEGLPSPPLDEGAFFATPTSMELSQFFDGMDDDGNPRNCVGPNEPRALPIERKAEPKRCPEAVSKRQTLPTPNRPKPAVRPNVQKNPMPSQPEKLNSNNETSIRMHLETAKRKLHERYQEAENAKKQRTIQVVEVSDLPKQSVGHRNQQTRPGNGNHNRKWATTRR